ncbi:peptidoglycan-binding protein [Kaistia defluvii]|uniref:glycoside hydrolase family protein n=1 Tax=Kaistia defluvii TaxID=410841 RepID=UPI00225788AB|nr:peptidoglycan-binding protein [Kaistia defluvii]MCX5519472.1 peptidoglycan-binding protein [Kaistia defluvii]
MAEITPAGLEQLVAEEGEVLRAYRDVAGVWTIGVGLTAASGVVAPKAGMVITRVESRRLLAAALASRYEPAVAAAMPGAPAHAFDGAVSFHFNTGAIARASWVKAWREGDAIAARAGIVAWNKAGGRVVEGLSRRRAREADLILLGRRILQPAGFAALRLGDAGEAVRALQAELVKAGIEAGPIDGRFGAETEKAVRAFQAAHPNLTVDGIVGPATRAQIARVVAARKALAATAAGGALATGGAGVVPVDGSAIDPALPPGAIVLAVALLALGALAIVGWRHRDEIRSLIRLWRS